MTGRSGHDLGREHVARLENYLASIDALPTRAGKVNVTAIARACGFDRQVLYKNPGARELLDQTAAAQGLDGIEADRDGASRRVKRASASCRSPGSARPSGVRRRSRSV